MGRRRVPTLTPLPKALACGMLEDGGRVLFLLRRDERGVERLEMPCVLVPSGRSPFADIGAAFREITGIDAETHEIALEGRHNAGSRKRRNLIPCLVFRMSAKNRTANPSSGFSGFRWLALDLAKRMPLTRNAEWLRRQGGKEKETEKHE